MSAFDPSGVGIKGSLFGFPYTESEAELIIVPMPWDVTVSYGGGTANGPQAILEASTQLDFSLYGLHQPWELRSFMVDHESLLATSWSFREQAAAIIEQLEAGKEVDTHELETINQACEQMVDAGYELASKWLGKGKRVAFLGGDHSTPLGLIRALSEWQEFGILQIDAHMDLRAAYEGFQYSHASIMHHAIREPGVSSITQVGIRDYCEEETSLVETSAKPVFVFYDDQVKAGLMEGQTWQQWVEKIIDTLPDQVYISFDIDGLQPQLCPNTGTPVPGGLSFEEADYLIRSVVKAGKKIIGFDLSEVSPGSNEWDANVGARVLFRLCSYLGLSVGSLSWDPAPVNP